ncbi:MAG: DUF1553 domain-containing protein [Puia sp.]
MGTKQGKNKQYRRALYTFWKRSSAYPSMITFDGVSREVCTVRRIRTNIPLQALATLNDSAYIDMARQFAQQMKTEAVIIFSSKSSTDMSTQPFMNPMKKVCTPC